MASATHVYRNGTILTMDSGGSQAQALAVRGETILAVGSDAEIMALADKDLYEAKKHRRKSVRRPES